MARGKILLMTNQYPQRQPEILNTHTDLDKIMLYLQGDIKNKKLSQKLFEKLERLEFTADAIRSHGSLLRVLPLLTKKSWGFHKSEENPNGNISISTATRDFHDAQRVFGSISRNERTFHVDILIGQVEENINAARAAEDFKAVATLLKLKAEIIEKHMGGNDAEMYRNFKMADIEVGFWPEQLGVELPEKEELDKVIAELKKPKRSNQLDADDIEFTPVNEE